MSTNVMLLDETRLALADLVSVKDLAGREVYTVMDVAHMLSIT